MIVGPDRSLESLKMAISLGCSHLNKFGELDLLLYLQIASHPGEF